MIRSRKRRSRVGRVPGRRRSGAAGLSSPPACPRTTGAPRAGPGRRPPFGPGTAAASGANPAGPARSPRGLPGKPRAQGVNVRLGGRVDEPGRRQFRGQQRVAAVTMEVVRVPSEGERPGAEFAQDRRHRGRSRRPRAVEHGNLPPPELPRPGQGEQGAPNRHEPPFRVPRPVADQQAELPCPAAPGRRAQFVERPRQHRQHQPPARPGAHDRQARRAGAAGRRPGGSPGIGWTSIWRPCAASPSISRSMNVCEGVGYFITK